VLFYGGDYSPEQWPERVWHEDVALMRRAGVNLVSLGVFGWSRIEPAAGEYRFDELDRAMDLLYENGVSAALATPTASPPPWFGLAHPEALPVTADGVRLTHGSRDTYCPSAPAYRDAAVRLATALADRYAGHPGLAMWHVHNEYGTICHCDLAAESFRRWLRGRYGSLERLNEAWTTAFWSQEYTDWAQVLPPRATRYLPNPAQALDFRRFGSDELLACYREQRDVLRARTPRVPVTTNLALGGWVPVDPWAWAGEVDLIAIDCYPSAGGIAGWRQSAFAADLARSWAGDGTWLLMEQAANLTLTPGRMLAKSPGELARLTLTHLARGSAGAMFFQWRASHGGAEMFHSAMVPHAGAESRVFRGVVELGDLLARLAEVDAGRVAARVALIWDAPSWWALQAPGLPSADLDYLASVEAVHGALLDAGVCGDFAHPEADLSGYRLVLVAGLFVVSAAARAGLARYVEGGGTLAVWYASGIVDADHRVWPGGYPGALRDLLGVRVEEFAPLPPGAGVRISGGATGTLWSERLHCAGATVEATYLDGELAGLPAVTRHRSGAGTAWYVSTRLDEAGLLRLVGTLLDTAGVAAGRPARPAGVELVRRAAEGVSWLFAINHTGEAQQVPASGVDLVSGERAYGSLDLPPGGYAVVREQLPSAPG
jgi:beta-galactosidase